MGKIVAFSGKATSGKTTAAMFLLGKMGGSAGAVRLSFASELKERALEDFGEYITADDLVHNKTKEIVISGRKTTVRQLLIDIGMMYRSLDKDFWLKRLMRRADAARKAGYNVLIDDMRFPNEYAALRELGATMLRVNRPGIPVINDESEWALDEHQFDSVIVNDGDLERFFARVSSAAGLQAGEVLT